MALDREAFLRDEEENTDQPQAQEESSQQPAGFMQNVADFFTPGTEQRQEMYNAALEDVQQIDINPDENEDNPGVGEWQAAKNEQARKDFVQYVEAKAANPTSADVYRDLHAAGIYQRLILTPEEKFNKAREIARETGLTTDAILEDETTYKNAMQLYDYTQKAKAAMGKNERLDYAKVLKNFPELQNIADMDDDQMVLALHDMSNIRELHNLFNDNKALWEQYLDYAKAIYKEGTYQTKKRREWYDISEMKDVQAAKEKGEALSRELAAHGNIMAPNMFNDPLKAVIYGVGSSMPEQLKDMLEGGGIGAVLGGVAGLTLGAAAVAAAGAASVPIAIGGAAFVAATTYAGIREGFWLGNFNAMAKDMQGEQYQKLFENRNANGRDSINNHSFTHAEMRENARLYGPISAFWEVAEQRMFMGLVTPAKKAAEKGLLEALDIFSNKIAREQAIDKAAREAGKKAAEKGGKAAGERAARETIVKKSTMEFLKEEIPVAVKAPFGSMVGEMTDEALQSATANILENQLKAETGRGGKLMTAEEIAVDSFNSAIAAAPGGWGFGFIGVPMHTFSATTGLGVRIQNRINDQERYTEEARHTILGANFLAGVQRIVGESKLNRMDDAQAKELQRKIIREQAKNSGFEMVYIDTDSVLETKGGKEQLHKIAEAANMDEAALDAAISAGSLNVPIESFAQAQADNSVLTSVSFSENEQSIAQLERNAKELARQQEEMLARIKEDTEKVKEIIVNQYFPDDADGANEAIIAMYENPTNPMEGLKQIKKNLTEAKLSLIQPALDRLMQGFGNGVDIVTDDEGRGIRVSNKEEWYQKWFAENKRNITKADLEELAEALMTGESNAPEIDGWRMGEAEYQAAQDLRDQLQDINNELKIVERTKEKLADMSASEIQNAIGLTPEAFSVYRAIKDDLQKGPGTSSRTARLNAIIFARHADRFAERYTEKTGRKFTALDYYNRVKIAFDDNNVTGGSMFQQSTEQNENLIYRYTNTQNPMSDYGHAMFSDSKEQTFSNNKYVSVVDKTELTDIKEFQKLLEEKLRDDIESGFVYNYPQYIQNILLDENGEINENGIQEIVKEFNPEDIVDNAEAWDNHDFVSIAAEIISDNEIKGVKTDDGGIVFDEEIIKTYPNNGSLFQAPVDADEVEFNMSSEDAMAREHRHDVMRAHEFSEEQIKDIDKRINEIAEVIREVGEKHLEFQDWQDQIVERLENKGYWLPKINAFVENGEYKLNMDLGTLCIKREAVDAAMQILIEEGYTQKLGPTQMWEIADVLQKHGYLIPCSVCFVEARRVRALDTANSIALHWHAVLQALGVNDGAMIGDRKIELTPEQLEKLQRMAHKKKADKAIREAAFDELIPDEYKRDKGDNGLTPDKMAWIATLMLEDNGLIGEFEPGRVMTSKGVDELSREFYGTGIDGFLGGSDGAATAKPVHGRRVYDGLSWKMVYDKKKGLYSKKQYTAKRKKIFDIGGVRLQSFSDFDVMLAFDYVQFIADLEARGLPAHTYTKIPELVQLFGKTGIKMNMSLLFDVVDEVDENGEKPPAGLKFKRDAENKVVRDKDGNAQYEYAYVGESFDGKNNCKLAYELRDKKGNVGTIAVALSDKHAEMLLNDDKIDMVIPYHKSGLPKSILERTGLVHALDYTDEQNTGNKPKRAKEFLYNGALQKMKDPRQAAQRYVDWCVENGYTPKFEKFIKYKTDENGNATTEIAEDCNYYKLLADFRVYDDEGNYSPQEAARLEVPDNFGEMLMGKDGQPGMVGERVTNMKAVEEIRQYKDELIAAVTKYQRMDGALLTKMKERLNAALKTDTGEDVVLSLNKKEFFNRLQSVLEKSGKENAKEKVDVWRNGDKIIYGFAAGGKIYLNESYANAHTPAHEFTHVWAKVVRDKKPELWKKGVKLMAKDKACQEIYNRIKEDDDYANIHNNEDAMWSEVLSRVVGGENEKIVEAMYGGVYDKRATESSTIGQQVMKWLQEFYGAVCDIFKLDKKKMNLQQFVNAPLSAIWDVQASKSFNEQLNDWLERREDTGLDSESMLHAETYEQETNKPKGATTAMSNGNKLVQLFESADESTFLHEMGHLFLMDLEELAQIDEISAKELAEVKAWAEWKKGDAKKYKDTPWYAEFAKREQAIIDAEMAGDFNEADRQKRIWLHERFARGFELYLKDGKAPSKGLRAVFRSFAKFLRQVYTAFTGDGARASSEVERIMGRMIATNQEIEAMALDDQFKDIEKAGGEKLLNETERETYERWLNEAKEEAREKLQKIVLADLKEAEQKKMEDYMRQEEEDTRIMLEQLPVNLARKAIESMGGDERGALVAFSDVASFREADKNIPTLEQALKEHMDFIREAYEKEYLDTVLNEEAVRKAMESSVYYHKAKELEAAALARKLDLKNKINSKAEQALQGIKDALDAMPEQYDLQNDKNEQPVKAVIAKINQLRFSTKWTAKDFAEIEKMIKAATRQELEQQIKEFKKNMKQQKISIREVEKANEGRLKLYAQIAQDAIAKQEIFNATNVNEHRRNQRKYEANVQRLVKAGNIQMALQQQQSAALAAAMAKEAAKAKEQVEKLVAEVNRQLNAKSVKLPAKERYWHRHLAYQLRIGMESDVDKPVLKKGQKLGTLRDLIEGYKGRLDLVDDYDVDDIVDIIEKNVKLCGYKNMTVDEFRKAAELLGMIYKCGKDEFSLKTIAGKTIDEAVNDIIGEKCLADSMGIQRHRIQDNTGGLGYNDLAGSIPIVGEGLAKMGQSYLSVTMKPEKLIELLGKKAHRYMYGTYEKAVNDEAEQMAKAVQDVQAMLAGYSHSERQAWKDIKYELVLPTEDGGTETARCSKENIICMALNLGTEKNRQRLVGGFFGPEMGDEAEQAAAAMGHANYLVKFISDNMTKKDWQLVQDIWNYLDTYWPETARVEEELNGMHLEKQKAVPFTVFTPDGEKIEMAGGYYPINFNKDKDIDAAAHAQDDVAKQQGGSQKVLGFGRSHVKGRSEADVFRELQLTFDTIPQHLQQVIHNITTRLAARDVYRLINHATLKEYIEEHLGAPYVEILNNWSLDVWRQNPEKDLAANWIEKMTGALRRNSVFAIMAYRVWPALENLSNIGPVADEIGHMNALQAVVEFYGHMSDFKQLMDKSVLMRNRMNNMDRDIRSTPGMFEAKNRIMETLTEHGYDLMTYSDLMFSAPLWCRAYKNNYMEQYRQVVNENTENKKKQQAAQAQLDALRGQLIDAKNDINEWHKEKHNRARAGQAGWQPGTSRFAKMPHSQFSVLLPELENNRDVLSERLWHTEAEQGHAAELKILTGDALIKEAERRAVAKADAAVRNAFGSGRTVDLAAVSRTNSEYVKAMTTFYSFFNTQFNALYFKYLQGKYGTSKNFSTWENMKQWMPFAQACMNRIIITSMIGSLLKMATKTDGDSDRDKYRKVKKNGKIVKEEIPWLERFLKVFGKNTLSMSFGAFYGFRDIANLAIALAFDGSTYGRGLNLTSTPVRSLEEGWKTIELIAAKPLKDAELEEAAAAEQEKLRKMNARQRAKYEENKKYKKPRYKITYSEIFRHAANAFTGMTAATTGIASTLIDAVSTTMQYMNDTENRYDANWRNLIWSVIFDKRPVEREIPQKPVQPQKKKKRKK